MFMANDPNKILDSTLKGNSEQPPMRPHKPDSTVSFVRLTFISAITTVLGNTLVTAQYATGKIRKYQIVMTICGFWVFPLTWIAFKLGGGPTWSYIIFILVYFGLIFVRIYLVKDMINLSWSLYVKEVLGRSLIVFIGAFIPPLVIYLLMPPTIFRFILLCCASLLATCFSIYRFGLQPQEKTAIMGVIAKCFHKTSKQ